MRQKTSFLIALFMFLFYSFCFAQNEVASGAWQSTKGDHQTVMIFQDGYFTQTEFGTNEFIKTWGGPFTFKNNQVIVSVEFNSADSTQVGDKKTFNASIKNESLEMSSNSGTERYQRTDNGKAPLAGVWKINAREQDGKMVAIHQTGARKTLKILTGKRFQWFAINPATKEFSGTGGGTYTFVDGKYTENILFFSRDNSRVGAHLTFDGKIENAEWHHSGLSSKGDKINEIWGKINKER